MQELMLMLMISVLLTVLCSMIFGYLMWYFPLKSIEDLSEPTASPASEQQASNDSLTYASCGQYARDVANTAESELLGRLKAKCTEFVNHLKQRYPNEPMTKEVVSRWNGEIFMSQKPGTGATFNRMTGCMIVNPYNETMKTGGPAGSFDKESRLLTRVLHELAHSWSGPHDAKFYAAQRWYLKVATEELNWKLDVTCRVCCYLDPLKCKDVCPKCTWVDPLPCPTIIRNCGTV